MKLEEMIVPHRDFLAAHENSPSIAALRLRHMEVELVLIQVRNMGLPIPIMLLAEVTGGFGLFCPNCGKTPLIDVENDLGSYTAIDPSGWDRHIH